MAVQNLMHSASAATTRTGESGQCAKEADRKESRLARFKHVQVNRTCQ